MTKSITVRFEHDSHGQKAYFLTARSHDYINKVHKNKIKNKENNNENKIIFENLRNISK